MESALRLYAWNLQYANALVGDLTATDCTKSAGPGLENHPAWTIGHLSSGSDLLAEDLGVERDFPTDWRELFERRGPGDPRLPDANPDAYPPMDELIAELARQHARVERAWRSKLQLKETDDAGMKEKLVWRFARELPTLGDATLFFAVSHEAMHLGQLAAWRRALGFPSALASM